MERVTISTRISSSLFSIDTRLNSKRSTTDRRFKMSRCTAFLTRLHVHKAKSHISLRMRAKCSEPPLVDSLWKHAYSTILKILPPKNENFQIKNSDIFHISAQNIDCGYSLEPPRRGGSNEYPQSMFWAKIWKIMYTPVNSSFTI